MKASIQANRQASTHARTQASEQERKLAANQQTSHEASKQTHQQANKPKEHTHVRTSKVLGSFQKRLHALTTICRRRANGNGSCQKTMPR